MKQPKALCLDAKLFHVETVCLRQTSNTQLQSYGPDATFSQNALSNARNGVERWVHYVRWVSKWSLLKTPVKYFHKDRRVLAWVHAHARLTQILVITLQYLLNLDYILMACTGSHHQLYASWRHDDGVYREPPSAICLLTLWWRRVPCATISYMPADVMMTACTGSHHQSYVLWRHDAHLINTRNIITVFFNHLPADVVTSVW